MEKWFDERGQYETGLYLYQQLFGDNPPETYQGENARIDVRIVTQDENISRLPWALLAHGGAFLATAGWAVSLANCQPTKDCELPPLPKILVVAPQPINWSATEADEHISDLRDMLAATDLTQVDDKHFRSVCAWSDFLMQLEDFQPDVLYYYGHGDGDQYSSKLIFEDQEVPLTDLRSALNEQLENSGNPPLLAYINCCQGDTGGLLGAGKQLVELIPTVLTNRTTAYVSAARKQAIAFWEAVLLRGEAPHNAVANMRGRLGGLGLSTNNIRWMTPVLHCQYNAWRANPPIPLSRLDRDPHWQLKLDRVDQFSKVFFLTHQMLLERQPLALAYLWYGSPEQGVEIFHKRLKWELEEKLPDAELYQVLPKWPDELQDPAKSFQDMICQAFKISTLEHLKGRIRTQVRQISGKRILVYVCHQSINSFLVYDPRNIKLYLEWWSNTFVPLLPAKTHAILGISFAHENPAKLYKFFTDKEKLNDLELPHTVFELLDELEIVTRRDLIAFIKTHKIYVNDEIRDKVLNEVLKKTQGSYVEILDELRRLENTAYQMKKKKDEQEIVDDGYYDDLFKN